MEYHQWLRYMNALEGLSADQVMALDRNFHFTRSGNSEIFAAWAVLATRSGFRDKALDEEMMQFLVRVGRRKFLTPIYKALVEADRKDHALVHLPTGTPRLPRGCSGDLG